MKRRKHRIITRPSEIAPRSAQLPLQASTQATTPLSANDQWIRHILSDHEAKGAYQRLTSGKAAPFTCEELNRALSVFFQNDYRRDWLYPMGAERLKKLPLQITEIAEHLSELDSKALFFMDTKFATGLPELVTTLVELGEVIRQRTPVILALRKGRAKHSEFDFKFRLVTRGLVRLARERTGKPYFEDLARLFNPVGELASFEAGVDAHGAMCKLPQKDTEITAAKIRGIALNFRD
jgi:hypothetical protein